MKKVFDIFKMGIYTCTHPSHLKVLSRDLTRKVLPVKSDREHLDAAMGWLRRSQDVSYVGGCAGVYSFKGGWKAPYPETTGYIIPTFIWYSELTGDQDWVERAKKLGDWEIGIQLGSGAVRGGVGINEYPIVFNTGQVILGWVSLYDKTGIPRYRDASVKAAEWLVSNMDDDGKWSKNTYNGIPHAYNARVAWAMMEVARVTGNSRVMAAAEKNIRWVLSMARENGWIDFMGFTLDEEPFTHTIVYTLSGIIECSFHVEGELKNQLVELAEKGSRILLSSYALAGEKRPDSFLPGAYDENWNPDNSFSCLTGNAQLAYVWLRLFQLKGDQKLAEAASKILDDVKSTQDLTISNDGIRGGIAGSYPFWGRYVNFGYPNWAAKFFADALMLKNQLGL